MKAIKLGIGVFCIGNIRHYGRCILANLFTLYIFYELLSVSTYALVGHHQDEEAKYGARNI